MIQTLTILLFGITITTNGFRSFDFFLTNYAFKILHGCNITFYFRIHSHLELKYEKKLEFQKNLGYSTQDHNAV